VVRIEGDVVRIEVGGVKERDLVVKTFKTVVKNKQFMVQQRSLCLLL
jgi:hypothetical protein